MLRLKSLDFLKRKQAIEHNLIEFKQQPLGLLMFNVRLGIYVGTVNKPDLNIDM